MDPEASNDSLRIAETLDHAFAHERLVAVASPLTSRGTFEVIGNLVDEVATQIGRLAVVRLRQTRGDVVKLGHCR